jgi:hypothetical protein
LRAVFLHPDLVAGFFRHYGDYIQAWVSRRKRKRDRGMRERREERGGTKSHTSSDVQPELARLGELPQTGT